MDFRIEEPFVSELDRMTVVAEGSEGWVGRDEGGDCRNWVGGRMGDFI